MVIFFLYAVVKVWPIQLPHLPCPNHNELMSKIFCEVIDNIEEYKHFFLPLENTKLTVVKHLKRYFLEKIYNNSLTDALSTIASRAIKIDLDIYNDQGNASSYMAKVTAGQGSRGKLILYLKADHYSAVSVDPVPCNLASPCPHRKEVPLYTADTLLDVNVADVRAIESVVSRKAIFKQIRRQPLAPRSGSECVNLANLKCVMGQTSRRKYESDGLHMAVINAQSTRNKASVISDYVIDNDIVVITETWLRSGTIDSVVLGELKSNGYCLVHLGNDTGSRSGRVAILTRASLTVRNVTCKQYPSFQHLEKNMHKGRQSRGGI